MIKLHFQIQFPFPFTWLLKSGQQIQSIFSWKSQYLRWVHGDHVCFAAELSVNYGKHARVVVVCKETTYKLPLAMLYKRRLPWVLSSWYKTALCLSISQINYRGLRRHFLSPRAHLLNVWESVNTFSLIEMDEAKIINLKCA